MAKVDLGSVVGPQGAKGDTGAQGPTGPTGNGISSITTVESLVDGGTNVVTVTMTNNQTATFNVKNGTKGSQGDPGTNGTNGTDGTDGISPTFSIENGHLYADYDHPYTPS